MVGMSCSELSEYDSAVYHEAVHSTGHHSRLNRITDIARPDSDSYSREELIAELGVSYPVHAAGPETTSSFGNSAAYIKGWLSALKDDRRFIVSADEQTEKAVRLIPGEEKIQGKDAARSEQLSQIILFDSTEE